MDERGRAVEDLEPLRRNLAQLATDGDQAVRPLDQVVGDAGIASEQAGRQRVGAGDGPLARKRMRHGYGLCGREGPKCVIRLREMGAAPDQQQRPLRPCDKRSGAFHVIGSRARPVGRIDGCPRIDPQVVARVVVAFVGHVLGDVDDDRAAPTGCRHGEGAADEFRHAGCALDADDLLDRRAQDVGLARFLRHVLPGMVAVRVADENDLRDAGVEAFDQPGHEVGRAGAERCVADTRLAGNARPGVGGEGPAALVVDQEMPKPFPADGIVKRQELEAAHTEHGADVGTGEDLDDRLAARHRFGCWHIRTVGRGPRGHCVGFFPIGIGERRWRRAPPKRLAAFADEICCGSVAPGETGAAPVKHQPDGQAAAGIERLPGDKAGTPP